MDMSSTDSESSDWDLEEHKALNGSHVRDSATSALNSMVNGVLMKENHHGGRVLNAQHVGPPDLYRHSAVADERHIYQVALQRLNQPSKEANLPDGLLSVSLLRHQKTALVWMVQKENSTACAGGILADVQGLGKTISTIALIQNQRVSSKPKSDGSNNSKAEALNLDDDDVKPTVVVDADKNDELLITEASSSTQRFSNRKASTVYHGGIRTKNPAELARYDVVLTTYAIVAKEVLAKVFDEEDQRNGDRYGLNSAFANKKRKGISGKKKKGKKGIGGSAIDSSGTLAKVSWHRVILDEAQMIKNSRTQMSKSCCGLRAKKRWCLSGTPIQDNIDELFSYFRFLKCEPYSSYKSFCSRIKTPISRNSMQGYLMLQAVLKAIMLRRTKGTLIDGMPIGNIPPLNIELTMVDFSPEERTFYLMLEAELCSRFKTYADVGTVSQNSENILLMLLRLQQACDHPWLVKGFSSASDPPEDAVVTLCGHVFCYQCVSEYLRGDDNTCPSLKCKSPIGADVVFNKATLRNDNGASSSRIDEESIVLQQDYCSSKIKAAIEIIRSNCRSKCSQFVGCNGDASSSSGVEGPIKAIVFSQWTRMLDLFEMSLNRYLIKYRRLDDSMSLSSRDRAVNQFNTDPEADFLLYIVLMSLKAGNLGLNMVAASHVILLDRWWNPTTEDQAIDRVHRIGQTRPVTVYRLTVKDTVEDIILARQDEKWKMVASALGQTSGARLTAEDLKYLFMGKH
ncbi:hypothetical protein L1987_10833 [Smallanthus sonchifolius]|uniref:Uncharacterized protein n=1 Tax=Smallanthus sonchifolius TaxID=185202 RepID=A0ACB9JBC3_9ASTR|nr:hypothetical protein L1987_10833 [Smallanthus sonchifolius]